MKASLQLALHKMVLFNDSVAWIPYDSCHEVIAHFTQEQWNMIMESVSNENEFRSFLQELKDVTACYLLKNTKSNHIIAFCLINLTDSRKNIISFHGGSWRDDLFSILQVFRGTDIILHELTKVGLHVRTQCKVTNLRAARFIKAVGFRCYRRDNKYIYFYLPANFTSIINQT